MAVLATAHVLHFCTETSMGPNLNLLPRHEPNPYRHNSRIHRPRHIIIFHDKPRL